MKCVKVTADFEFKVDDSVDVDSVELIVEPHAARLVVDGRRVADCHEHVELTEIVDEGEYVS